jgi:hypothetical protein
MTTIIISKEEKFSMICLPEHPIGRGRIVKTQEAIKIANEALKSGTAEKTCDTEYTLMYQIND